MSPPVVPVANELLQRLSLTQTEFGEGACRCLRAQLDRLGARRPLLVRDPAATAATNIDDELTTALSDGDPCTVLDVGTPLAPEDVDRYGQQCHEGKFDCVVAVGGGATLDAAKLIALRASNDKPMASMVGGEYEANSIPIIAVPTTAGSGSEATQFAVLFVDGEKHSISHASLRPSVAIVDPTLIASVPRKVAAAAGLDVLCQAIESLWSRRGDDKSRLFASESLRLVVPNLHPAVMQGDADAQAALCLASHLAGQAINRSTTTICHALSYMITARYRVPHGMAAAATLPASLLFNYQQVSAQAGDAEHCLKELSSVFQCSTVEAIARELVLLIRSVGGAASVAELALPADYKAAEHARKFNPERLRNNPRPATPDDIVGILLSRFDHEGNVEA